MGVKRRASAASAGLQLLIADDDPTFVRFVERTLGKTRLRVSAVSDGFLALEHALSTQPPDILLLDWIMPKMNGTQVCRLLRAQNLKRQPYVILATARGRRAELVECMSAGADDILQKPIAAELLLARAQLGSQPATTRAAPPGAVLALLEDALLRSDGELSVYSAEVNGRIFIQGGLIAWAEVADGVPGLSDVLTPESERSAEATRAVVDHWEKTGERLSDTLLSWGLAERARLREAVRVWVRRKVHAICRLPEPRLLFRPASRAQPPDLLFTLREIFDDAQAETADDGGVTACAP